MSLESAKFPLQIYSYNKGCGWYDLTLAELETKCCIYGACLYWTNTIPVEEEPLVDTFRPNLYDISNYDSSYWWEWPADLKKHVEDAYHKKKCGCPEDSPCDDSCRCDCTHCQRNRPTHTED